MHFLMPTGWIILYEFSHALMILFRECKVRIVLNVFEEVVRLDRANSCAWNAPRCFAQFPNDCLAKFKAWVVRIFDVVTQKTLACVEDIPDSVEA